MFVATAETVVAIVAAELLSLLQLLRIAIIVYLPFTVLAKSPFPAFTIILSQKQTVPPRRNRPYMHFTKSVADDLDCTR